MRVAVGISGGVDSAVAALLLKERGDDLVGVTMTLGRPDEERSLAEAREVAARLEIPLHVIDLASEWKRGVADFVAETYRAGETPNPCVRCNELIKFGLLPRWAFDELGSDRFATGHYARLGPDGVLRRGVERTKDQSYFLYRVPTEILIRTILPLGDLTKSQVREKARTFGFQAADRKDSQDFCGGDPMDLVARADQPGDIVTSDGRLLGRHRGYWHYTVGMRKGLGLGGGGIPYYVTRLDPTTNQVIVGTREETVNSSFLIKNTIFKPFTGDCPHTVTGVCPPSFGDCPLAVKVRSTGEPQGPITLTPWGNCPPISGDCPQEWRVDCRTGIFGVAPGQSAVFYCGDRVIGGGVIAGARSSP